MWLARALAAVAAIGLIAVGAGAQPAPPTLEVLQDAELTDILFLDPDRGFAIGERGAILRTDNGGRNWRFVESPFGCRWESIHFVDEKNGWIAGGFTRPLTHQSIGIILRTRDGGRTWLAIPKQTLPGLKQIRFFNPRDGYAIGQPSDFFPSGVFRTSDGGESWRPAPGAAPVGWNGAALHSMEQGVLVGASGHVATVLGKELKPARMPDIGPRPVRRVALSGPRLGWLVGDGGLVLASDNGGYAWTLPAGDIPGAVREQADLRALAVLGDRCWIAGAPGSFVLHTPDRGATWETQRTGHHAPLRALFFLDAMRGWAVGSLGTILATRDGGKSWQVQRQGGKRAALVALYSEPSRVPWEVLTRLCGDEGYLGAVEITGRTQLKDAQSFAVPLDERTQAALAQVCGSSADTAWRFPLRDSGVLWNGTKILEHWNRTSDGDGAGMLESHVVARIRQWRPEVILTERATPRGDDPLAHVTNQIVLAAVAKAGDPTAYPDQLVQLGLTPWKVRKVLSTLPPETKGMINQTTAQLAPRLGASLADAATGSRNLIATEFAPAPAEWGFQIVSTSLPQEIAVRDFFSGINLVPGQDARRALSETSPATLDTLRREAQRSHNIRTLMDRSAADATSGGSWLGQVDDLTRDLSRASAGSTLYELAWRYHASGQSHSAADAFSLLVERYPDHDLADAAALWLVQYYSSSEIAARLRRGTKLQSGDSSLPERAVSYLESDPSARPADIPQNPRDPLGEKPKLTVRTHATTAGAGLNDLDRAHQAIDAAKRIQSSRPRLAAQPELVFPLAASQRQVGMVRQAESYFRTIAQQRTRDAWWSCAAGELWLMQPAPEMPKPVATCVRLAARPHLDGLLDDEVWKLSRPLELASTEPEESLPAATVLLAHDGQFLYLAAACDKVRGGEYPAPPAARKHDEASPALDRLEVLLDLDRDYATSYSLTIDARGCTGDACFGDATWNPKWFVAVQKTEKMWFVEAAIPLAELNTKPPAARDAWALGVQRVVPGHGVSSWTRPAAVKVVPQGFGLLLWE